MVIVAPEYATGTQLRPPRAQVIIYHRAHVVSVDVDEVERAVRDGLGRLFARGAYHPGAVAEPPELVGAIVVAPLPILDGVGVAGRVFARNVLPRVNQDERLKVRRRKDLLGILAESHAYLGAKADAHRVQDEADIIAGGKIMQVHRRASFP